MDITFNQLMKSIDYTQLDPRVTADDLDSFVDKACDHGVRGVCVQPSVIPAFVRKYACELRPRGIKIITVVSFPDGADSIHNKIKQARRLIDEGVDEIDVVVNYRLLMEPNKRRVAIEYLQEEAFSIAFDCKTRPGWNGQHVYVKGIVESGVLSEKQTKIITKVIGRTAFDCIKTSTGQVVTGAEISKVRAMRDVIIQNGYGLEIKASGGISTIENALRFLEVSDILGISAGNVEKIISNKK